MCRWLQLSFSVLKKTVRFVVLFPQYYCIAYCIAIAAFILPFVTFLYSNICLSLFSRFVQNNELRASSSKLEMTLRMERHTNSQLRLRAAEETCGSIVQIGMPSYRGDIAAPPPVVADELEIESGVYEEELVALESAALGASQPKKRSATPTSSQFKSVVLMLAALR